MSFFLFDTVLRLLIFSKYKTPALFTIFNLHSMYHLPAETVRIKKQTQNNLYIVIIAYSKVQRNI